MNDNLPPLPPCAPEFKPRWPNDPGGYNEEQMQAYARAAIERQSVPAGYVLVPIEPTESMTDATYVGQHCSDIWRDMIAAAPQPQPERCKYCDGTGDVHRITGEWRGVCDCEAGKATQPQPVQEPVGWIDAKALEELRLPEMTWMPIWNRQSGNRPVALYTSPQAQPLIEVLTELESMYDKADQSTPLHKGMRMAISTACDRVNAVMKKHCITKGTT